MREMLKMVLVLSLICGLSGFVLAGLKEATRERIELQVLQNVQGPALSSVFPPHDNDPLADRKKLTLPDGRVVTVFPALKDGRLAAVALEQYGKGYGGDIGVMVGFSAADAGLTGIGITTMKETPGLGSRVAEHGFTTQFKGHGLAGIDLASRGGDIDGVSGATYSSIGAVDAVQQAAKAYAALKPQIDAAWPAN